MQPHDNPQRVEEELRAWAQEEDEEIERRREIEEDLLRRVHPLLLRARDAGLTNTEIAAALNQGYIKKYYDPEALGELDLDPGGPFTPQLVTARMRDAESLVEAAARRFIRRATREDGDGDDDEGEPSDEDG